MVKCDQSYVLRSCCRSDQLFADVLQLLSQLLVTVQTCCVVLHTANMIIICHLSEHAAGFILRWGRVSVLMSTWYSPSRCLTHYNYNSRNTTWVWYYCTFQQSRVPSLHRTVARTCLTQSDCNGRVRSSLSVPKMETRVKFLQTLYVVRVLTKWCVQCPAECC